MNNARMIKGQENKMKILKTWNLTVFFFFKPGKNMAEDHFRNYFQLQRGIMMLDESSYYYFFYDIPS